VKFVAEKKKFNILLTITKNAKKPGVLCDLAVKDFPPPSA